MNRKVFYATLSTLVLFAVLVTAGLGGNAPHQVTSTTVISANNAKGLVLDGSKSTTFQEKPQRLTIPAETLPFNNLTPPQAPVATTALQGGDNIATATAIPSMPFNDVGTTVGFTDDYEENTCIGATGTGNADVVYSYTPSVNELVTISLCNSTYYTNLWIYQTDASTLVACNRFNSQICSTPRSGLVDVPMDSNTTYYIVIDGDPVLNPDEGDYEINCTSYPAPFVNDSSLVHPAIGDAGNGWMMLAYEDKNIDTSQIWAGSNDDGASFPEAGSFSPTGGQFTYPSIDYQGFDSVFYGTLVPSANENHGASTYLFSAPNPVDGLTWGLSSWDWYSYGWHDMRMADIACDAGVPFTYLPGEYRFGILSMVHSTSYTSPAMVDAPHLFYQIDSTVEGWATISWYPDFDGCQSTTCDIDKITQYSYAAYDQYVDSLAQWTLLIRRDNFADFNDETNAGMVQHMLGAGEQLEYPAIAANNGNILVATEYYSDAAPDHDIICWYTTGSDYENMTTSVVISTPDDERYPEIAHVSGTTFVVSYIVNNQLYIVVTDDGGATWGTPTLMSDTDYVISEYRSADISDRGLKVAWEYQPGLPDDSSRFIHFASTGLVVDTDGDGVDDDNDNCPTVFNPGQEDADADGIGDVCDDCTDIDGDGFGDPGFPANTCQLDNCPTLDNPGQEDADIDGIGDACDPCTDTDADGFGDPGFAGNTCAVDNCPNISNPGQEDTNADGIGDACCCVGTTGDVDGDGAGPVITDLTYLVDYLFAGGAPPGCPNESNIDGADGFPPLILDLTYLVDFLFASGPPPANCP